MRRLTKLLQRLDYFNQGIPEQFFSTVQTLNLSPGESIPDTVPSKSWTFVEEGLLLLKQQEGDRWLCGNIYNEGTSTLFYPGDPSEPAPLIFRVEAVEQSTVLYLSTHDEARVNEFYPHFSSARRALNFHSLRKSQRRNEIHRVETKKKRIEFVEKRYPVLLRVPTDDLAVLLDIRSKTLRMTLTAVQRKYQASKVL